MAECERCNQFTELLKRGIEKEKVKDAIETELSHEYEPRGVNGSFHKGQYQKPPTYLYDVDCERCNFEKKLGIGSE